MDLRLSILLLVLAAGVLAAPKSDKRPNDSGNIKVLPNGDIQIGDIIYTREQYEELFGKDAVERYVRTLGEDAIPGAYRKREAKYKDLVLDGDVWLTKDQNDALHGTGDRTKRKAVHDVTLRWTNGVIPYEFYENDFSESQKKDARVAFDFFEKETCLKFRPSTPQDYNKTVIRQGWGGCNSQLGMVGGAQNVNLDNAGCRWFGLYLHEFGHAIGLIHEHQLPDRDNYVDVLWNNVNPWMRQWFKKYGDHELRRYGIPYDLSSVMHYELNAFAKLSMRAIRVKDPKKDDWIGRVYWKTLSFTDTKLINLMYSCNAHCPSNIPCPAEGFIDKHCKCVTPREYFDRVCINLNGDADCTKWALEGQCGGNPGWMNINCRRACNACPRFGVEELLKRDGDCWNAHIDQGLCEEWARNGLCEKYPSTVKRWCRKSCNACGWEKGRCPNLGGDDTACDRWAEMGECQANPLFMKPQCSDSCGTCGWEPRGECANKAGDAICDEKEKAGQCHTLDPWMFENCAASCDTCNFNAGNCQNELSDKECSDGFLNGDCDNDPRKMKIKCARTCNTCGWGKKGDCTDRFAARNQCQAWADYGSCPVNPGWMGMFCAASCNVCDYPAKVANKCENSNGRDSDCANWASYGECENNPEYMRMNCQKACNTCHFTSSPNACFDLQPEEKCKAWKAAGKCDSDLVFMLKGCTKTCDLCDAMGTDCFDDYNECVANAKKGWCATTPWMQTGCRRACGLCGKKTDDGGNKDNENTGGDANCFDEHHDCKSMVDKGMCTNTEWMKTTCRRACGLCKGVCQDRHESCKDWVSWGHCHNDSVKVLCEKSCNLCPKQ